MPWTRTCEQPRRLDKPGTLVAYICACFPTTCMLALAHLGCCTWWTVVSWAEASASRTATPRCNLATSPWSTPHREHMPRCAPEHALSHHPFLSITSRSFHPFYAITAHLGMEMPLLVYLCPALLSLSFKLPLATTIRWAYTLLAQLPEDLSRGPVNWL
jgi:hypothetical protein